MSDDKLDIRLPNGHPLLKYPKGTRSKKAREAIETGLAVEKVLEEIKNLLYSLDTRVGKMESTLENMQVTGIRQVEVGEPEDQISEPNINKFDVDAFMNFM